SGEDEADVGPEVEGDETQEAEDRRRARIRPRRREAAEEREQQARDDREPEEAPAVREGQVEEARGDHRRDGGREDGGARDDAGEEAPVLDGPGPALLPRERVPPPDLLERPLVARGVRRLEPREDGWWRADEHVAPGRLDAPQDPRARRRLAAPALSDAAESL